MDLESIRRAIKANKNEYQRSELTIRRNRYAEKKRNNVLDFSRTKNQHSSAAC
jgi:hypothetical protein